MTAAPRSWAPESLSGMVALITGASQGLGQLLAQTFAARGAALALVARSAEGLATTVEQVRSTGGTAEAVAVDVTDHAALAEAVESLTGRLGPIDALVNNAGIAGPVAPLWEADPGEWLRTVDVNLGAPFALARLVLPAMIAAGHGRIVNITSNAAIYRWPLMSAYVASKAGLVKLSETLAAETGKYGVAVFSVDPGLLPLGLSEPAMAGSAEPGTPAASVQRWLRSRLEAGHGADPDQAALLVVELAAGKGDPLSGCHLTAHDDLDALLANAEQIERESLHRLRLLTRPE